MEQSQPRKGVDQYHHLNELEKLIDHTLATEDVILDGLKRAVYKGWLTNDQLEEQMSLFHEQCVGEVPAISPEDLDGSSPR